MFRSVAEMAVDGRAVSSVEPFHYFFRGDVSADCFHHILLDSALLEIVETLSDRFFGLVRLVRGC